MNRAEKLEITKDFTDKFKKAKVALFADYKGLSATQADELRKQLRTQNCEVKVLKNNLARLAAKDNVLTGDSQVVMEALVGPTLVAFAYSDAAGAAKVIHKFSKENEALKLKDSLLGNKKISAAEIEELANLPSKEVLIAKMLGTMNAPITNFVGVLAALPRGLVTALSAIEKKKQS